MKAGHECVVSDTHPQAVKDVAKGAKSSDSIADFREKTQQTASHMDDGPARLSIRY